MSFSHFVVVVLTVWGGFLVDSRSALEIKKIQVLSVTGVDNGSAALPCDVAHPTGDTIVLILWFRDGRTTPIYRFDDRSSSQSSSHWADDSLAGRASLDVSIDPARLVVKSLKFSDSGFYRCRVDFSRQPTKTTRVNLSVVVPPSSVTVYQEGERKSLTSVVGPFNEGDTLTLTCIANGGKPRPQVVWYQDTRLLDSDMESEEQGSAQGEIESSPINSTSLEDEYDLLEPTPSSSPQINPHATQKPPEEAGGNGGDPFNTLTLGPLTRNHLKMLLTCEAANNNITLPTSQVVMVDMNLSPLGMVVRIPPLPLIATKNYTFECDVFGGRPPPVITWWKGNDIHLKKTSETTTADGNKTTNSLHFTPSASDDGSKILCRAEGNSTSTLLKKEIQLSIHYVPMAEARYGSSLDSDNIKEGDDVYFECLIDANPKADRVYWRHNNQALVHNITAGIIMSNQSLVMQRVIRDQAGLYTCHAFNILGDGASNPQRLDVKYAPVCSANQVTSYAVSRHEDAEVTCTVDANPPEATFQWTFNNTADTIDVPNGRFTTASSHSVITYTPVTSLDYGTLLCWASNDIGMQKEPCLFHIVPAGKPDAPSNCSLTRRMRTSVKVVCQSGNNGGFEQAFHLQVSLDGKSLFNLTSEEPDFKIDNLTPGQKYGFTITAENERGSSFPTQLTGGTRAIQGTVYKDGPSEAEVRDGGKNGNGFIPPNTSSSSSSSSSSSKSSSSSSSSSLLEPLDLNSILPLALGVGAGLVLIIIILIVLITMRSRFPRRHAATRSHSEHTMLRSPSHASIDNTTQLEGHIEEVVSTTRKCSKRDIEIDLESDIEPDIIPVMEDFRQPGSNEMTSCPAPSTLLPPEQYAYQISNIPTVGSRRDHPTNYKQTQYSALAIPMQSTCEPLQVLPKTCFRAAKDLRSPSGCSTLPHRQNSLTCNHRFYHPHHTSDAPPQHHSHLHHVHHHPSPSTALVDPLEGVRTTSLSCKEKRCSQMTLLRPCDGGSPKTPLLHKRESSV